MNSSESKIDLVIAGYPKSGNTWLTRLVAQTLDSPSIGYFGKPNLSDTSTEGLNRTGNYRVYKSHELPDGIMRKNKDVVIISIIRDPRETFASGLRFFKPSNKYFQKLPGNQWWVLGHFYRLLDTLFSPKRMFRRRLLNAYVHGNFKVQSALGTSWVDYYGKICSSRSTGAIVRYEDLLERPELTLQNALNKINVNYDYSRLTQAVQEQSLSKVKSKFEAAGGFRKLNLIKVGSLASWKSTLTSFEVQSIEKSCHPVMNQFEYEIHLKN